MAMWPRWPPKKIGPTGEWWGENGWKMARKWLENAKSWACEDWKFSVFRHSSNFCTKKNCQCTPHQNSFQPPRSKLRLHLDSILLEPIGKHRFSCLCHPMPIGKLGKGSMSWAIYGPSIQLWWAPLPVLTLESRIPGPNAWCDPANGKTLHSYHVNFLWKIMNVIFHTLW